MALIKCSKCGNGVSDQASSCPKCGNRIKKKSKINIKILGIFVIFLCILFFIKLLGSNGNLVNRVTKIIENDYGKSIHIVSIYYNKEQEGCIIEFTSEGISDIACIHLEDQSIGYESVYNDISERVNDTSLSDADKQKYAMEVIEYPYDTMWVYDLFINGTNGSEWEKVQ